jgi:hypothetical protein
MLSTNAAMPRALPMSNCSIHIALPLPARVSHTVRTSMRRACLCIPAGFGTRMVSTPFW